MTLMNYSKEELYELGTIFMDAEEILLKMAIFDELMHGSFY